MRTVSVVDLISGLVARRHGETLTLDLPADLDRGTGGVSVDADRLGGYFAAGGTRHVYGARPTRLATRTRGEECLVADEEIAVGGDRAVRRYRLCAIEPSQPSPARRSAVPTP